MKNNLGIGIANATWVLVIGAIIIFTEASLWLLAVPILFNWSFIRPTKLLEKI